MAADIPDVHRDSIVIVGHSDIVASDVDWRRESGETRVLDRRHLPTLRAGGVTAICDHIGGDAPYGYLPATRLSTDPLQRFMRALDHAYSELSESDAFVLATTVADIRRAKADGTIALVICLEGGAPLQNELAYLRNFHRLGLRCLGLTHDMRNEIGDGVRERSGGGLTHFGVRVVEECNRLGIVVDVSHLSDRGLDDVLEVSRDPIIASHSNARALCDVPRNLTDDQIRRIAAAGGVIGFHALKALLVADGEPTLDDVLRHIGHIAELGGPECIAIGPDVMENWDESIFHTVTARGRTVQSVPVPRLNFAYPAGMASNADLANVSAGLARMGFADAEIAGFLGGNLMRVFEAAWKSAT